MIRISPHVAAVLLLSALATGCTTKRGALYGIGIGGIATVTGSVLMGTGESGTGEDGDTEEFGAMLAFSSMCVLAASLVAYPMYAHDEDAARAARARAVRTDPTAIQRDEHARRQARAWKLTRMAEQASRGGDCGTVHEVSGHVKDLDAAFYAYVFLRDVGIQRCLAVRAD